MTDSMHRSGFVQACKRWCCLASQLALGPCLQYLLRCIGHCLGMSKSEGSESTGMTRRGRAGTGEIGVSVP